MKLMTPNMIIEIHNSGLFDNFVGSSQGKATGHTL